MLLLLPLLFGAEPAPEFRVYSTVKEPAVGAIQKMEKDRTVQLRSNDELSIPGVELVSLRQTHATLPATPSGAHVVFANGDKLPGRVTTISNGKVNFRMQVAADSTAANESADLAIPLSALAVIWLVPPPESLPPAVAKLLQERRRQDVVLMNNGDWRQGTVDSASKDGKLRLKEKNAIQEIDVIHVTAIALNTDLARTLKPRGAYPRVVLRNGCRLSLLSATGDDRVLAGRTLFAADISLPWREIAAFDVLQGPAAYLSDLKPKSYSHTPFLGVAWPYMNDRSVSGGELRLGGNSYDKGVGLHSECRISYALDGAFRRFESIVGLDDHGGRGGNVRIRVFVDGQEKAGGELNSGGQPRALAIDLTQAKDLTLVVEFGSGGDVCDHVNWADARLIK